LIVAGWAAAILSIVTGAVDDRSSEIDYDRAVRLDAEDLAELGIGQTYRELAPHLAEHGVQARPINELIDEARGEYVVEYDDRRYPIGGWGLATYALFDIVNSQLPATGVRLYAINGGNDLSGILMTPTEAQRARRALPRKADWPYLPTAEPPWFGEYHD
jgi:hypothetical protein